MAGYQYNLPVVMTTAGAQPTAPATIQAQVLAAVQQQSPGFTSALPGSMQDDLIGGIVAGASVLDGARAEAVNSVGPNVANLYVLAALAAVKGIPPQGVPTYTSVPVVFTGANNIGYVVPNGFLVSDGTHTYQIQTGGVIGSSGSTQSLIAIATTAGTWSVPIGTVTTLASSLPSGVSLTVSNPAAGTPGGPAETPYAFRARCQTAERAVCSGGPSLIKTLLANMPNVQANLISVQQEGSSLKVVVTGGDQYYMAYAIYSAVDPNTLTGSTDSGGSSRNVTVSLYDYPDTYSVIFVTPIAQTVTLSITWYTTLPNFTGGAAFASLVQPVLSAYINQLAIGQAINPEELQNLFAQAVSGLLDPSLLTTSITVFINGAQTNPNSSGFVVGDVEGYFTCSPSGITVTQG